VCDMVPCDSAPGVRAAVVRCSDDAERAVSDARPCWMSALAVFCAAGLVLNLARDLFFPETREVEVWLGFEVRGPLALATAPLHWAVLAAGAWGFWRRAAWLWPWAGVYVLYVALSHLVWSEASQSGRGWPIGLAQMFGIGVFGVLLLRARSAFQPEPGRAGRRA